MAVFSLQEVKKLQVQNVIDNNFASWPEGATRGYYGGGYNPSLSQSNFLRIDFNTETVDFTPNILPEQMTFSGSVSNPNGTYGYLAGSQILSSCKIRRLDFSNETVSQPGYDLPQYKSKSTGLQSDSYGYFGGGYAAPSTYFSTIVKLDFSNDTTSPVSATLSQKKDQAAGSSSSLYGYIVAGYGPPPSPPPAFVFYCNISRLDFSNETLNESAVGDFPFGTTLMSGTQSSQAGYFTGGTSFPYNCTITRLDFSSETLSDPGGTLTRGTAAMATVQNNFSAYFGGGYSPPGITYRSSIYKLDFASETVSNPVNYATPPTNNLRKNSAGISGGQSVARGNGYKTYGYYGGGYSPRINTITRLDFSNETTSNPGNNLPTLRNSLAATSSNSYGYFGSGFSQNSPTAPLIFICTITRLDFTNETVSDPGNNLPTAMHLSAATSSDSYGYFGGGNVPPWINTISRLDFTNETVSNPANNLPTSRGYLATTSSNSYGYFGGGNTPNTPTTICTITRLDFSNETVSDPGNNLPTARYNFASTSNNSYGYFGGGTQVVAPATTNTITRLDFSNETVSNPGNNLPTARSSLATTSSSFYGYYAGGDPDTPPPPIGSTIDRIDFSNETVSNPGNNLPSARESFAAVSNSN